MTWNGNRQRVSFGRNAAAAVSASTADVVVAHGLDGTPTAIVATAEGTNFWYAVVAGFDATNVTLRIVRRDGAAATATITINWMAML